MLDTTADKGKNQADHFYSRMNGWIDQYKKHASYALPSSAKNYFEGLNNALDISKQNLAKIFEAAEEVENDYAEKCGNVAFEMELYTDRINALLSVLHRGPVLNAFIAPAFAKRLEAVVAKINEQNTVLAWTSAYISAEEAASGAIGIWRDTITGEWFENILVTDPVPTVVTRNIDNTVKLASVNVSRLSTADRHIHFIDLYKLMGDGNNSLSVAEKAILAGVLSEKMTLDDRMKMVFNESGEYGGDQGSPVKRFASDVDYQAYMRSLLGKKKTKILLYLEKYNSVGCGYMALANTIFVEYANRPKEFERVFGFPMYTCDASGNICYNFDYIVIDMYNSSGMVGKSTVPDDRKKILEGYLNSKNIAVDVTKVKNSIVEIDEALNNGQIILRQRPVKLYKMDGALYANVAGGHAIVVTGVSGDGNLIVSSWGKQFIVKPSDYPDYSHFKLVDPSTWGSYLDFEVVTFE